MARETSRKEAATDNGHELRTERLRLRRWREADRAAFAQMNADPEVMEHFPAPLTRRDSDLLVDRIEAGFDQHGFGLWAIEVVATGQFVGFTGLSVPGFEAHFTPAVEIDWRLTRPAWGQGYATEAARAVIDYGFTYAALPMIVSFTAAINARSRNARQSRMACAGEQRSLTTSVFSWR